MERRQPRRCMASLRRGVDTANPGYGAAWSDAGVIVPWTGWVQSGDRRIVDENWEGMESYLAEILKKNPNHLWQQGFGAAFGDWLTPTITTPEDLLATAYWAYDATLMRQMAVATGTHGSRRSVCEAVRGDQGCVWKGLHSPGWFRRRGGSLPVDSAAYRESC